MYSILVPVYNQPISPLAQSLLAAAKKLGGPCEIIFAEDGSTQHLEENAALAQLPGVAYHVYKQNRGRAAIRNLLGEMSQGDRLIFLDCDIALPDSRFLQRYSAHSDMDVLCGGHSYPSRSALGRRLHHKYGSLRECPAPHLRNQNPYKGFKTSNFLIKRSLFDRVRFDESLSTYGHEDTLYGHALQEAGARLLHIDNPVVHLAMEPTRTFLTKSRGALSNALMLVQNGKLPVEFVRAVSMYYRLKGSAGGRALLQWLERSEPLLLRSLHGPNPRLRSFDFLKLVWLYQIEREQKKLRG